MKGPSPQRLWNYASRCLGLKSYFRCPGDGRVRPDIPAHTLLKALLWGRLLRYDAFLAVERLVRSVARKVLGLSRKFGDDALGYFTERLLAAPLRAALAGVMQRAKRNKAFDSCRFIGLAVDGTTVGRRRTKGCRLCRPHRNRARQITGYRHHVVMIAVVGTGLFLPCDIEPYGPRDSEYAAGQRLLRRARGLLGARFADYVVVDGEFATAPFLHLAGDLGWWAIARLKDNLPELHRAAQRRFAAQPPHVTFWDGSDRVEIWDADDFDPWETLRWETVRVLRYRQHHADGEVVEAFWLTDFPSRQLSSRSLYYLAKSRWEIENQGFNDAKNRYGFEHLCHHHPNSLLLMALLTALALTIERLYRLRYLHRGTHRVRAAADLVFQLWLSLSSPRALDSS